MTLEDFCKYVLDNLNRATSSNALNICDKLDNDEYFKFIDFVETIINESIKRFNTNNELYSKILDASYRAKQLYLSEYNYNKVMIKDNYILDLWEAVNGFKAS